MATNKKTLAVSLSPDAVALLRKMNYPCSEGILASATPTEEGVELRGTKAAFEDLAGWVAGDANHMDRRKTRTIELLHAICDELEAAIDSGERGR